MGDQWTRWRRALDGQKLDMGERGNPPSGFYRRAAGQKGWEAVCVFRDDAGTLCCIRNKFGDGSNMGVEDIDELFASEIYAVPEEVYRAVAEQGHDWPPEHLTRLTLKEIQAGVVMTTDLARKKAGLEDEAENPRAVIGDNKPPEDLPLDRRIADRISTLRARVGNWLQSIGGAARTKEEADKVADYASKFSDILKEADEAFKTEKDYWLKGGREVDAKWKFRTEAGELRQKCLAIGNKWIDAEKARLAEEARKQHEAAQTAARKEAEATGEPVADVKVPEAPKVTIGNTRTVSQRERKVWVVTDRAAFVSYIIAMNQVPPDFTEVLDKIAHRLGSANVPAPGIEMQIRRSAA